MKKRTCYYIPPDHSSYIEGRGFRVAIVTEDEPGYTLSGTWPYTGAPGETLPYFWGHDMAIATRFARLANKNLGLTEDDVSDIILSSMRASHDAETSVALLSAARPTARDADE